MCMKDRASRRYNDIGRIAIDDICAFPGVLDNVSRGGFKMHYVFPVNVDFDSDYEAGITCARAASNGTFSVLCHPQWSKNVNGGTEIGFKLLPSKDSSKFCDYVSKLGIDESNETVDDQIADFSSMMIK